MSGHNHGLPELFAQKEGLQMMTVRRCKLKNRGLRCTARKIFSSQLITLMMSVRGN